MLSTAETPTAAALPVDADAATPAADAALEREATKLEKRLVRQVAQDAGLGADVNVASLTGTWYQHNESDLAFLLRLLGPHDVMPRLEQGQLRARDEEPDRAPISLDPNANADHIRIIADLNHQPAQVLARGWNLAADSAAQARCGQLSPAPRNETAADLAQRLGWPGESLFPHPLPRSQAEAEALAQRGFRARAGRFLHGEILCRGEPNLRSGREVTLRGVSPRLAGRYRVVDCEHSFDAVQGYRTRLKVERPDWNP